jgi:hypothetical protein
MTYKVYYTPDEESRRIQARSQAISRRYGVIVEPYTAVWASDFDTEEDAERAIFTLASGKRSEYEIKSE